MNAKQDKNLALVIKSGAQKLKVTVPADDLKLLEIPGVGHAKLGVCYVRVTDLPDSLDDYMEINPRVPSRTKAGVLSGPVVKGILETLRENPHEMVIKNQGIYVLVDEVGFQKTAGARGQLMLTFSDPGRHGIINGGHTYAAIREAIETAEGEEAEALKTAFVRLHIFQGIDADFVPEIAEGLNRSKQVDDPSLSNLQGEFDTIRKVLRGVPGAEQIAYHQGDEGSVYISELLVYLSMFNQNRYDEKRHPNGLYNRQALGLKYFSEDMAGARAYENALIQRLPDFLWLADSIRKLTPAAARHNNFRFGRAKIGTTERAGNAKHKGTPLPFIAETVNYRVPNGWVYPMLAAFRANLQLTESGKALVWKMPLAQILPDVIDDLVGVCVSEHKDNNTRPELIGKREAAYSQCYTKMQLFLAKRNLLY